MGSHTFDGITCKFCIIKRNIIILCDFWMLLFASFRIGIYTTTLGVSIKKAWAICFVQPLAMFLVLIPQDMWFQY